MDPNSTQSVTISKHHDLVHAVTCKVCLDVPLTGHLHQCANGHLICRPCYDRLPELHKKCPECRGKYVKDRSSGEPQRNLLADMVVDKIKVPCK